MVAQHKNRWWATAGVAVAATALLAAIPAISPSRSPLAAPSATATEQRLTPFEDCGRLTRWYVEQALPDVTAWGLGGGDGPIMLELARDGAAMGAVPESGSAAGDVAAVGNGDTGTNVQEAGVDEPDVAKLDGDGLVVSIQGNRLVITDVSGEAPRQVGEHVLSTGRWSHELLIVGDTAIVLGTLPNYYPAYHDVITVDRALPSGGGSASMIVTLDISDASEPQLTSREKYSGSIASAREHDGTVRVVLSSSPQFDFVDPYGRRYDRRYDRQEAKARNREIVNESSARDWLPRRGVDNRGQGGEPLLSCDSVTHPDKGAGLGTISVLTLDPESPHTPDAVGVSAEGSLVYASADRLYVSTIRGGWDFWSTRGNDWRHPQTEVHAFATEGTETAYVASGSVPGIAPDRWAFSEYDGRLRVATKRDGPDQSNDSAVTVLEEQGSKLI
ncbi:MAG: beta-propeller domain-containing protein, partial [Actinomycetota bacterium]|nr:beta-propeller domain-containing protein [Actinomycetota bacterium]